MTPAGNRPLARNLARPDPRPRPPLPSRKNLKPGTAMTSTAGCPFLRRPLPRPPSTRAPRLPRPPVPLLAARPLPPDPWGSHEPRTRDHATRCAQRASAPRRAAPARPRPRRSAPRKQPSGSRGPIRRDARARRGPMVRAGSPGREARCSCPSEAPGLGWPPLARGGLVAELVAVVHPFALTVPLTERIGNFNSSAQCRMDMRAFSGRWPCRGCPAPRRGELPQPRGAGGSLGNASHGAQAQQVKHGISSL